MKNAWMILLCVCFTLAGYSDVDDSWPAQIVGYYAEPETDCTSFGPGYASISIDTQALVYEKRQKFCGDALIHWEQGIIEKGESLVKITDKTAIALPGDEPEWQEIAPTVSGSFFLDDNVLIEYSSCGAELVHYYLGFLDDMSVPICLMPHDRDVIL